jgi:phage-related baseplate assembly protein
MTTTFTPIDLSRLPAPVVVEQIDYESILAERKAYAVSLWPADQQAELAATLALESEPLTKLLQESAYRETLLRQRVNEAALAVLLPFAQGADLEQIGARFNVVRLVITPANRPQCLRWRLFWRTMRACASASRWPWKVSAPPAHATPTSSTLAVQTVASPMLRR